jgi:hypothetical protein
MTFRNPATIARAMALIAFAFLTQFAAASVLFENSVLHDFHASGPVSLGPGQNANVCVTNVDESPVSILIGLLQADTGSLLAVEQATLPPGEGACLAFTQPSVQPNQQPASGFNVVGIVVPNAQLSGQGAIVQDRPGGGCITASLQIQTVDANNVVAQTLLYLPMQEHHEHVRPPRAD